MSLTLHVTDDPVTSVVDDQGAIASGRTLGTFAVAVLVPSSGLVNSTTMRYSWLSLSRLWMVPRADWGENEHDAPIQPLDLEGNPTGDVIVALRRRNRILAHMLVGDRDGRVTGERRFTREHFVEHAAQRVNV